jgi:hypothetical protein
MEILHTRAISLAISAMVCWISGSFKILSVVRGLERGRDQRIREWEAYSFIACITWTDAEMHP